MPDYLTYILKILLYFVIVLLLYIAAKIYERYFEAIKNNKKLQCIVLLTIFSFGFLFGSYSVICGKYPYESDRYNYAFRYENDIYLDSVKHTESIGLYYLELFLHIFSHNPNFLFFSCSFLFTIITLTAYILKKERNPKELLFLGISSYFIFSFYLLKQSIAAALVFLSYTFYLKEKKIASLSLIIAAIFFHESSLIIVPLFFIYRIAKNKRRAIIIILLTSTLIVFFPLLSNFFTKMTITIFPNTIQQLSAYLDENNNFIINYNFLTAIKGLPFYLITTFAILRRKSIQHIHHLRQKIVISIIVSTIIFLSIYMYWMYRFSIYLYPFMAELMIKLAGTTHNRQNSIMIQLLIFGSLATLTFISLIQYYFWYGGF